MTKVLHLNSNYTQSNVHYMLVDALNKNTSLQGKVFFPCKKRETTCFNREVYNTADFLMKHTCLYDFEKYFFRLRNCHLMSVLINTTNVEAYDLLFAHSLFSNGYLALSAAQRFHIPYLVFVTSTDVENYFKHRVFLRKIGIEILVHANLIFFSSSASCEKLLSRYIPKQLRSCIKRKCYAVPFGIDDFWLEHSTKKSTFRKEGMIHLLYIGKITERKNIPMTIQACEKLIAMGHQVRFVIVGDCSRDTNPNIIKRLEKYPFVSIHKYVPIHELLYYYQQNDIFVMPSVKESFGLVYAEALSQGLPIIYSSGEGFDGHFSNYDVGVSVDPYSVNEIVDAILYILANYQKMSDRALIYAKQFSWKIIVEKIESVVMGGAL